VSSLAKTTSSFLISTSSSPTIAFLDLISWVLKIDYLRALSASSNQNMSSLEAVIDPTFFSFGASPT
jgi:hypothetical protein